MSPADSGQRCGAIISRSLQVTAGEGHQHSSELVRWDQAYRGTGGTDANPSQALKDLLAAGVRASVVAPEPELRRWFSWQWYWTDTLVDDLIRQGRLRRVDGHVMTAGHNEPDRRPQRLTVFNGGGYEFGWGRPPPPGASCAGGRNGGAAGLRCVMADRGY